MASNYPESISVQVTAEVATKNAASAEAAGQNLQKATLLSELENQGLPGAKLVHAAIKVVSKQDKYS